MHQRTFLTLVITVPMISLYFKTPESHGSGFIATLWKIGIVSLATTSRCPPGPIPYCND